MGRRKENQKLPAHDKCCPEACSWELEQLTYSTINDQGCAKGMADFLCEGHNLDLRVQGVAVVKGMKPNEPIIWVVCKESNDKQPGGRYGQT